MNQDFSKILYFGSPFLPIVSKSNFEKIAITRKTGNHSHLFALAHELCDIGIQHNQMHFEESDWIFENFQIGSDEVIDFLIGFTIFPLLLMGSDMLEKHNIQTVISGICRPSEDSLQIKVNQYKSNTLIPLYLKLVDIPKDQVSKKIVVASEICDVKPFSTTLYFLAGQKSAMRTGLALITPPS